MKFEALYYQDRLKIVNPEGDVAITTLWSKVESAYQILEEAGVDLAPATSRIGPIANLYGNGLPQMLRNLLWNPQIRHIVIVGQESFRLARVAVELLRAWSGRSRVSGSESIPDSQHDSHHRRLRAAAELFDMLPSSPCSATWVIRRPRPD